MSLTSPLIWRVYFNDSGENVTLSQIDELDNFERVNVRCKAVNVKKVLQVNVGTATGLVILWEESIGGLIEEASYHLVGFMIQEYRSRSICVLLVTALLWSPSMTSSELLSRELARTMKMER